MKNRAFIDAQNLHLGTTKSNAPWNIDNPSIKNKIQYTK